MESLKADKNFRCVQFREELDDRLGLAGQNGVWGDFTEWLKHEAALVPAGMWERELRGFAGFIAKGNNIQVQRARLVEYFLGLSPKLHFQCLQFGE